MTLRRGIFIRTLLLLAALIVVCCLSVVVFLVWQNRAMWIDHCMAETEFIAEQSERLVLWNDKVALHDLLTGLTSKEGHFRYAFVENENGPYVHTFEDGVPVSLLDRGHEHPAHATVVEYTSPDGGLFYDISARIPVNDYRVHLGIYRHEIDSSMAGTASVIAVLGVLVFLLCLYPAWLTTVSITHEVDIANSGLQKLNEELEARVADRTRELVELNSELETEVAGRVKLENQQEEFFAMLRHDMRNSLSIIGGNAELLHDEFEPDIDEAGREMLSVILNNSKSLSKMVENMSVISKLESGRFALNLADTSLQDLVVEAVLAVSPIARERNTTVEKRLADGLPTFRADGEYLRRAVINLLTNAITYTQEGGSVIVETGLDSAEGRVYISVSDNGPGIAPEEQSRVFDLHYRSPKVRDIKGSGLGLAIVKLVAEAHGGTVELDSTPGSGSTFRLTIPA